MERIEISQEERDKREWLKRARDKIISQCEAGRGWESATDYLIAQAELTVQAASADALERANRLVY